MVLTMYLADKDGEPEDERVLGIAVEESLLAGSLGFNPWFTEHHFRGPWHSNPMQFAAYIAPQLPPERYLGFGVLSTPYPPEVLSALLGFQEILSDDFGSDVALRGPAKRGIARGFLEIESLGFRQ